MIELLQVALAILIPICGGLAYLALKHPHGYQKIYVPLQGLLWGALIISFARELGLSNAFGALVPFIEPERMSEATKAYDATKLPFGWFIVGTTLMSFYMIFLSILPAIVDKPPDNTHTPGDN